MEKLLRSKAALQMNNCLFHVEFHAVAQTAAEITAAQRCVNCLQQVSFTCAVWSNDNRARTIKIDFMQAV